MLIRFGCNPQIIFVTFLQFDLCLFFSSTSTKAYRHWVTCEHKSSYNFTHIVLKFCRCFCQGLMICMRFDYMNHKIIFVTFLQFELSHFFA